MKKIYIFKHPLPSPPLPHSFGSGTFALNSHTYNPLFEEIVDPPLNSLRVDTLNLVIASAN